MSRNQVKVKCTKKRVNLTISQDSWEKVQHLAKQNRRSVSNMLETLIISKATGNEQREAA